jgi:hypothetical protein
MQKTLSYRQTSAASVAEVFPLLCPVREKQWLDGWDYRMIHSESGLIEANCVFATPNDDGTETIWLVTEYDSQNYKIAFARIHPGQNTVHICIELTDMNSNNTRVDIQYTYTALSTKQIHFIENDLEKEFIGSMQWWEKAINHYLQSGQMLMRKNEND